MNEEIIKDLLDRLFGLTYKSEYSTYTLPIISKEHRKVVEQVVRQWVLENNDSKIATPNIEKAIEYFEESICHCKRFIEQGFHCEPIMWMEEIALKALCEKKERQNPKRLTIEELKSIDAPVWVSCITLEGEPGYWCLCQKGSIICPSGQCFDAADIPHWKFYLHKPKEGEK